MVKLSQFFSETNKLDELLQSTSQNDISIDHFSLDGHRY